MKVLKEAVDQAEQRCKTNGSRLTSKRKQVLSLLLKSDKALSAYELVDVYKNETGQALPAMSMYRILSFLEDQYLAHRLELTNKYIACSHINCDEGHALSQFLICSQCQKVEEVSIGRQAMEYINKNIRDSGFHLASPQLEINCICDDCMAEQPRNLG